MRTSVSGPMPGSIRWRSARRVSRGGHIVSGGSTLTMQLARLLEPRRELVAAKLRQIVRAIEIERQPEQGRDPRLYLTLAPYGGNLEGIRAASLAYFGKEPKRLTLGRGRVAGGAAAVAGSARPRPLPARRRGARATACSTGW